MKKKYVKKMKGKGEKKTDNQWKRAKKNINEKFDTINKGIDYAQKIPVLGKPISNITKTVFNLPKDIVLGNFKQLGKNVASIFGFGKKKCKK